MDKVQEKKQEKNSVVSEEIARKEIEVWLDYKKIDDQQREDQEGTIKSLISFLKAGHLVLNPDKSFTHILKFELENAGIKELTYKARLPEKEIRAKLHGVKSDDGDGRLSAHICALTGQVMGIINALDKEDFKVARYIAIFFV